MGTVYMPLMWTCGQLLRTCSQGPQSLGQRKRCPHTHSSGCC